MSWEKDTADPERIARAQAIAADDLAWATAELNKNRKAVKRTEEVYIAEMLLLRELIVHRRMLARVVPDAFDVD